MWWTKSVIISCCAMIIFSSHLAAQTKVEIAHWWTSKGEAKAVSVIKKAFEQTGHQWIDSSVVGGAGNVLNERLKAQVAAGTPPVAVQMFMGPNVWQWGEQGALANLNEVAEKEGWKKVLPPLITEMIQYEGNYAAVPVNVHRVNWMWINPEVFRKAQAKIPHTWDEFFVAAEKIEKAGFIPIALGGEAWQEATLFEAVLLGVGGIEFHKKTMIELDLNALKSAKMTQVFETMRKIKNYVDKDSLGRSWDKTTAMVMNGKAAIQIMGDWAKGEFLAAGKQPGKDFICRPAPQTQGFFLILTDSFAMFKVKDTAVQEAQKTLAQVIMQPAVQEQFNIYKGSIPARLDISPERFDSCGQASMADFADSASKDALVPTFAYSHTVSPDIQKAMVKLISTHFQSDMPAEVAAKKLSAIVRANQ